MCGILGMAFQAGHTMKDSKEVLGIWHKLLVESNIRGSHATGCAFINLHNAIVIKHHIPAERFVDTDYYKKVSEKYLKMNSEQPPLIVIGHTRLKTKGSPLNTHNNHPILTDKVVGVHNGIISNDDSLFDLYKMKRKAQVDSEVIFRLIEHHLNDGLEMEEAIQEATRVLIGGLACAAVQIDIPWVLWLFRTGGPISIYRFPERGLVLFASAGIFLDEATKGLDLGNKASVTLKDDYGIGINVLQNKQVRFKIKEQTHQKGFQHHGN